MKHYKKITSSKRIKAIKAVLLVWLIAGLFIGLVTGYVWLVIYLTNYFNHSDTVPILGVFVIPLFVIISVLLYFEAME